MRKELGVQSKSSIVYESESSSSASDGNIDEEEEPIKQPNLEEKKKNGK